MQDLKISVDRYIYICIYIYIYVYTYIYIHIYIYIYIYIHRGIHIGVCVCARVCVCVCVYMCDYVCVQICMFRAFAQGPGFLKYCPFTPRETDQIVVRYHPATNPWLRTQGPYN